MPDRSAESAAMLYVVATPIGNVGDLSPRARDILASVSLIAAEDTRHTGQLLQHFGIATPTTSLHEHNEDARVAGLVQRLLAGESIALVSDAGTPLISDPGYALLAAAREHDIPVTAVPGPCAGIAALSVAGLPSDRFIFEGFLPAKSAARRAHLETLRTERRTLVFYEGPHRIAATLEDLATIFGSDRPASVSRELTKRFETHYRATLGVLAARARTDADMQRGEIVIVVAGLDVAPDPIAFDSEKLLRALLEELSPAQAAKIAARLTSAKRAQLYDMALALKGQD